MSQQTDPGEQYSIIGRVAAAALERRWTVFLAELLLIVIGILAALTIDGWAEDRENLRLERSYLSVLSQDLSQINEQLQAYIQFESSVGQAGSEAISILYSDSPGDHASELRTELSNIAWDFIRVHQEQSL